ncbi:unnamed protein product [Enterobius vermicularis]|uniref:Cytochrome P450 n=1 Tax=Enterobius vermicularis TaxID=51028 RepID=A0A0N4VBG2_ENTVE|nr:unnamed protein product [Enterobius vermicularis]
MLTCAFQPTAIKSYEERFNTYARVLLEVLDQYADKDETFDLLPYLKRYSVDFMTDATFGIQVNTQKGENLDYYEAVTRILELGFETLYSPWLRIGVISRLFGHARKMDNYQLIVRRVQRTAVIEGKKEHDRMKEKTSLGKKEKKCFLDWLLNLQDERNLSFEDVCEEIATTFFADAQFKFPKIKFLYALSSHDNVSSSIGFVLFILGLNMECQNKIYEELNSVLGDEEREVTTDDVKNLVYLDRCIKENLRLYPQVVIVARRITEDIKIGEYTIPAGVTAYISPFSAARDPREWKEPDFFNPDNFSAENIAKRDPFSYIPFSAGIRNCIGQKFASAQERIALAHLLRRYEFHSMVTEEQNRAIPEVSLRPSRGFPMRITRRKKKY